MKKDSPQNVRETSADVPTQWSVLEKSTDEKVLSGWLADFKDATLIALVDEALENNPGLQITETRLKIIKDSIVSVRSAQLPRISSSMGGSYSGGSFREADDTYSAWEFNDSYNGGINLSWEVDVWGKLANREKAAIMDLEAAISDFKGSRLSLAANIARAYCNLITAKQQVELAEQTLDIFKGNLRITERNYIAGDPTSTALAVQLSRNNVASAERTLINSQLFVNETKRNLEVLLGRYPVAEIDVVDELPILLPDVPAGLPSELLIRRPDLVSAIKRIEASTQRKIATRKTLLPSIILSGGGSARSNELADLLSNPQSLAANVAASLSQPVFQGGALRAQVRQAETQEEIAVQTFTNLALFAFREVESALDRENSLMEQEEFLGVALKQAILAEQQASRDYSDGLVGILSVLESQRRASNARNAMINLRNSRIQNRITLHLALGGDFESDPALAVSQEVNASKDQDGFSTQ